MYTEGHIHCVPQNKEKLSVEKNSEPHNIRFATEASDIHV